MPTVYDDEKTYAPGGHDDLGVHPEHAEAEAEELRRAFDATSYDGPRGNKDVARADELNQAENSGTEKGTTSADDAERLGLGFTAKGSKGKLAGATTKKSMKKWLFAGGALASIVGGVVAVAIFVLSSFGLINFSSSITEYAFIRLARQSSVVSRSVVNEGIGQQLSRKFAPVYEPLKARYSSAKELASSKYNTVRGNTWGRFDNLRYDKILKNLGANGNIEFNYAAMGDGKTGLDTIKVGSQTLKVPSATQLTWKQRLMPFASDIVEFNRQQAITSKLIPTIEQEMGTGSGSLLNRLARYRATKAILSEAGITRAGYKIALEKYKDTKVGGKINAKIKAKALDIQDRAEKTIKARGPPPSTVTSSVASAAEETRAAEKAVLESAEELEKAAKSGAAPDKIVNTASGAAENASGANIKSVSGTLGALNTAYAIALPACLIYEGSISSPNSGETIDSATNAAMQTYADVSSKADNQKLGTQGEQDAMALAELSGATTEALGDVSTFYGSGYASPDVLGVQADANGGYGNYGDYSLINIFLSTIGLEKSIVSSFLNEVAGGLCATITNPYVAGGYAVGSVVAKIVLGVFTGGGSVAAEEGAVQAIKLSIKEMVRNYVKRSIVAKVTARQGAKWATTKFSEKELTEATLKRIVLGNKLAITTQGTKDAAEFAAKSLAVAGSIEGVTYLTSLLVASRSGHTYSSFAQNTELQTQAAIGAVAQANETSQAMGGRPLTRTELEQTKQKDIAALDAIELEKSTYARLIAPDNYRSLTSRFIASVQNRKKQGVSGNLNDFIATALDPTAQLRDSGLRKVLPRAYAEETASTAGDTYYHMLQFGFSEDELELMQTPKYAMKENERALSGAGDIYNELHEKYRPCTEASMGTLLSSGLVARDDKGDVIDAKDVLCSPTNLSYQNPIYGDLVFRDRALNFQSNQLSALEDLTAVAENAPQSSVISANSTIDKAHLFDSSENVACAPGTRSIEQIQDGYHDGKLVRLRLCAIPGFKSEASESSGESTYAIPGANGDVLVNSRVSGAWLALFQAAKNDRVILEADSGWRSMAKQTDLCKNNQACRNGSYQMVAQPGTSPHQIGLAIDFSGVSGSNPRAQTCDARAKDLSSPTWRWLENSAARYGFRQYSAETWHWDPLDMSNRCGGEGAGVVSA